MSDEDLEVRKEQLVYMAKTASEEISIITKLFDRYLNYYMLKKAIAWILHVKYYLTRKTKASPLPDIKARLSATEVCNAEKEILEHVQREAFPDLIRIVS